MVRATPRAGIPPAGPRSAPNPMQPVIIRPELVAPHRAADAAFPALQRWLVAHMMRPAHYRIDAVIVDDAPSTLDALLDATRGTIGMGDARGGTIMDAGRPYGQRIPVSGEHAERTIWSDPEVNALFRAWHDALHILHVAPMDQDGETLIARAHQTEARRHGLPAPLRAVLWAETYGQTLFHAKHGTFPFDQRAFVRAAVTDGVTSAVRMGVGR